MRFSTVGRRLKDLGPRFGDLLSDAGDLARREAIRHHVATLFVRWRMGALDRCLEGMPMPSEPGKTTTFTLAIFRGEQAAGASIAPSLPHGRRVQPSPQASCTQPTQLSACPPP